MRGSVDQSSISPWRSVWAASSPAKPGQDASTGCSSMGPLTRVCRIGRPQPSIRHSPESRDRQQVPSRGSLLPTHGLELIGPLSGRCYLVWSDLLMNASQFSLGVPLS